ncbi:MAG: hypothetical protein ACREVO_02600 [Steroidobacteraceae bacterium]
MSEQDIERLCSGYRKSVENPPYDAVDGALLHAAARQARRPRMRRLSYGIAASVLAALGLVAGARALVIWHRPVTIETRMAVTREAPPPNFRSSPRNDYLSDAMLTSGSAAGQANLTCRTADDLNAPGALDRLRVGKPGDYARIMRIIAGLTRHPDLDVARWIRATFHAANVSYLPLWLTTFPPKRRLSFCLASSGYTVVLTLTSDGAHVSPALAPPRTP